MIRIDTNDILYAEDDALKEYCNQITACTFTSDSGNTSKDIKKIANFLRLVGKKEIFIDDEIGLVFYYENGEFYKCETDLELQGIVDNL